MEFIIIHPSTCNAAKYTIQLISSIFHGHSLSSLKIFTVNIITEAVFIQPHVLTVQMQTIIQTSKDDDVGLELLFIIQTLPYCTPSNY